MGSGGKGGSSAKPPSPGQVAGAQSAYDVYNAALQQRMNMVNQTTPFGSISYNPTEYTTLQLPQGKNGQIDRTVPTAFSANTTLSPQMQNLLNTYMGGLQGLGDTATRQFGRAQGMLSQPFDMSQFGPGVEAASMEGLPEFYPGYTGGLGERPQLAGLASVPTSFTPTEMGQYQIDEGGQQKMLDSLMGQMAPQIEQDRTALATKLANQGVSQGSEAYKNAMQQMEDQIGRNRQGAVVTADEQARADALARLQARQGISGENRSNFLAKVQGATAGNQDLRNTYSSLLGARGQALDEYLRKQSASESARGNEFNLRTGQQNAEQSARNAKIQEALMGRQVPLQEIMQMFGLAGGGVQMPQGAPVPQAQMQAPNYAQGVGMQQQSQLAQQQQQQQMWQQLMGGLFGLGGGLGSAAILA